MMAEDPGQLQALAQGEFSNRPTSLIQTRPWFFSSVLSTNSSRHANLEGAQECFEIGLGLAFTRRESGLEEPPAQNN